MKYVEGKDKVPEGVIFIHNGKKILIGRNICPEIIRRKLEGAEGKNEESMCVY